MGNKILKTPVFYGMIMEKLIKKECDLMKYTLTGLGLYGLIAAVLWLIRPRAAIHRDTVTGGTRKNRILAVIACAITILACTLPMKLSPYWAGEIPDHRNQYELMADAILDGQLSFEYDVDEKLPALENPYDPAAREEADVDFHWDHAFYNGKYYMYFGVVPVFLVFIPFKVLTGMPLTTYHATQLFVGLFIAGIFALFRSLSKKYFKDMTIAEYLLCCVAFSVFGVWYTIGFPALYCTAISAALCMEIWSLYFFFRAAYETENDKATVGFSVLGALFGALAFGCRPPIALANILVLPLAAPICRKLKKNWRMVFKIAAIILPYIVIGVLLMIYNYVRFDDPFEFGQSYQLTVADQTQYTGGLFAMLRFGPMIKAFRDYLFAPPLTKNMLKWGLFILFPILDMALVVTLNKRSLRKIWQDNTLVLILAGLLTGAVIIVADTAFSPYPTPRYLMDFAWIFGIVAFLLIGTKAQTAKHPRLFSYIVSLFCCFTVAMCIFLFLLPSDCNFTQAIGLDTNKMIHIIKRVVSLGILK